MKARTTMLAVAALVATPVFAQSSVTVYGVVDLTMEQLKASGATGDVAESTSSTRLSRTRLQTNSSLIGFKGVEDLGNGLKALFQIETAVNADTGGFGGGRDTFVALSSAWGTLAMGNITHPIRLMGAKADLNPGATGIGFVGSMYEILERPGSPGALSTGTGNRQQLVAYATPSLMGLTGTIAYGPGESATAGTPASAELKPYMWQAALQYENGPLYAGLGYHESRDFTFVDADQDSTLNDVRIAGRYTLGTGTTIAALWDRQKSKTDSFGATPGTDFRRDAWSLSLGQTFGAHTLHGGYARAQKLKGSACSGTACDDTGSRMWTLAYEYALSKRTMIKAVYADIRNQAGATYDFMVVPISSTSLLVNGNGSALLPGADPRGFGIGVRHSF